MIAFSLAMLHGGYHKRFLLKCSSHDCFDGVHTVFGFFKDDGCFAFEDLIGYFHGVSAEFFAHFLAYCGLEIVVGGQAVHKYCAFCRLVHKSGVHLVG